MIYIDLTLMPSNRLVECHPHLIESIITDKPLVTPGPFGFLKTKGFDPEVEFAAF